MSSNEVVGVERGRQLWRRRQRPAPIKARMFGAEDVRKSALERGRARFARGRGNASAGAALFEAAGAEPGTDVTPGRNAENG